MDEFKEITANYVIDAIGDAIRNEFTSEEIKAVYKDKVPQNFLKPCICVLEVSAPYEPMLNELGHFRYSYDLLIHKDDNIYSFMRELTLRLTGCLQWIQVEEGRKLRGRDIEAFVKEDIGHFMISYNVMTQLKTDSYPLIEDIERQNTLKK